MKIKEKYREKLWEDYNCLSFKLNSLKAILQNPSELTEKDILLHKKETIDVCNELKSIHTKIVESLE